MSEHGQTRLQRAQERLRDLESKVSKQRLLVELYRLDKPRNPFGGVRKAAKKSRKKASKKGARKAARR
jgi:hypothetical protein